MPSLTASTSGDLSCREVTTEEGFLALQGAWGELGRHASYPSPFAAWEWAWHWWRRLAAPDPLRPRLLILAVSDADGMLAGIAPFFYPTWTGSPLLQRPLRLLGTRQRCRMEDMTDEPALLLRRGCEEDALAAILAHLAQRHGAPWDAAHLQVMRRKDAPGLADLWRRRPRAARMAHSHRRETNGQIVSLPGSWAEYRRSLSKSMRDNLTYYPRLLDRRGHSWQVRTARTPDEVRAAADVLITLHHRRAQSTTGAKHLDHLPTPRHEDFLRDALGALAARGDATVWTLEVAGIPVAAQAVLGSGARGDGAMITFHYSGFDPHWHAYSPVLILNAHALQDAIGRGIPLANYLPGAEPWKTRWGATDTYAREELTWVLPRPLSALRAARRAFVRAFPALTGGCDCGFCALPPTREEEAEEKGAGTQAPTPSDDRLPELSA